MSDLSPEQSYRNYIAAINSHSSLSPFVHRHVIHNGQLMTASDYEAMIKTAFSLAPDLKFNLEMLIASGNHVAARIWLDCTPEKEFLGFPPSGKKVHFSEHVFYRYDQGKIKEVWSVLDTQAIAKQLESSDNKKDAGN